MVQVSARELKSLLSHLKLGTGQNTPVTKEQELRDKRAVNRNKKGQGSSPCTPRTPRTPRIPRTPRTPRTSRTPHTLTSRKKNVHLGKQILRSQVEAKLAKVQFQPVTPQPGQ